MAIQQLIGFSYYFLLALLFCTVRRRNGFAAVQDLVTKTRVISRAALRSRPALPAAEMPPPATEDMPTVGPYHVLETLETNAGGQWLLGYDLRLLRKVWVHTAPPGVPPLAAALRNIGRVGRLRWLTGRRSPEENWDAFEGVSGQPLLRLIQNRQPWGQVRFWLSDLAKEISAAEKDGTLPQVLALDRIWITGDGRAKLLDFPAPGRFAVPPGSHAPMVGASARPSPGQDPAAPAAASLPVTGSKQRFLGEVAVAALEGRADAAKAASDAAVPLPLNARSFLQSLPQLPSVDAVAGGLQPLLRRTTAVSRLRCAAVVAGCAAFPVLTSCFMVVGLAILQQGHPGIMELSLLLQTQQARYQAEEKGSGGNATGHEEKTIADRQLAIFIASHYGAIIANDRSWNDPIALSLIRGEQRQFAEQCLAEYPAPTNKEIADADAVWNPPALQIAKSLKPRPFLMGFVMLAFYVSIPAVIAAVLFRGGLVLLMAGITFVRRDGKRASRLRHVLAGLGGLEPASADGAAVSLAHAPRNVKRVGVGTRLRADLLSGALSVALPQRGLPDRFAGTWPVPR